MPALDKFKAQITRQGLLRGNRFKVRLIPPLAIAITGGDDALERYAHTVALPGRSIEGIERSQARIDRLETTDFVKNPNDSLSEVKLNGGYIINYVITLMTIFLFFVNKFMFGLRI